MTNPLRTVAVGLSVAALLAAPACRSEKSAEQQKVEALQAQLDDANKKLAEKEAQAAAAQGTPAPATPGPAVAPQSAPPASPPPAEPAPQRSAPAPADAGEAPRYVTAEQGQKVKEQYAEDKAKVQEGFEQQQEVNRDQSRTNAKVQQQIEELKPREYTIPAGTVIPVRNVHELSSSKVVNGAVFDAVLEQALVVDGTTLAPSGAHVAGVVVSSDKGGRVKGVASLEVAIRTIHGARDQVIRVRTDSYGAAAGGSKGRDATRTGILAGAGAVVGAIAGGGKGAAIGLGAGAATGVGVNAATRGKAAVIPAETLMEFRLTSPVTVVVRP